MMHKRKVKLGYRSLAVVLAYLLTTIFLPNLVLIDSAHSAQKTFQLMSPIDTYTSSNFSAQYDLEFVEVGLFDNNSDNLYIWLHYKGAISRTMFTSNSSAWAMAAIWTSESRAILGGNDQEFRILPNRSTQYPLNNSEISADAYVPDSSGSKKTDLSKCKPTTWSDVSSSVKWIGMKISRSCAGIPEKFWIAGYTSYASDKWDWAPEKAMYVDLSSKTNVTPSSSPTPSATPTAITKRTQNFYFDQVYSQYLINRNVSISTRSDGGFRSVRSTTPVVCQVNNSSSDYTYITVYVNLISEGTCTLEGFAPSTSLYFESARSYMSFQVLRTEQEIDVTIPDKPRVGKTIDIEVLSTGDGTLQLRIKTPKICSQPSKGNQYRLKLIKVGTCRFDLFDPGSNDFLPYEDIWEFDVLGTTGANPKPSPSPKKSISGSATTTKNPSGTPSNKPSTSTKIGGTADTKKP
jgi:hypothetical protein